MPEHNKPEIVVRDGSLKATVWRNEGEKGDYYTTQLAKTYTDAKGNPRDTASFSQTDLLRIAELGRETYGMINELRREKNRERTEDRADQADRDAFRERRGERTNPNPNYDRAAER